MAPAPSSPSALAPSPLLLIIREGLIGTPPPPLGEISASLLRAPDTAPAVVAVLPLPPLLLPLLPFSITCTGGYIKCPLTTARIFSLLRTPINAVAQAAYLPATRNSEPTAASRHEEKDVPWWWGRIPSIKISFRRGTPMKFLHSSKALCCVLA